VSDDAEPAARQGSTNGTLPLATSYIAPTSRTFRASSAAATEVLPSRISCIERRTFSSATFVTHASSCKSPQCAAVTAGLIFERRPISLPSCASSIAPFTAPCTIFGNCLRPSSSVSNL
jgi:hypothetical protein